MFVRLLGLNTHTQHSAWSVEIRSIPLIIIVSTSKATSRQQSIDLMPAQPRPWQLAPIPDRNVLTCGFILGSLIFESAMM
jgi:hypothetical protein